MTEFLAELRRRHIFRIGGIYVVVAWGIAQVIDFLSQVFALPDWIAQPVAVVLAIGFPVVLIAAWIIVGAAKAADTPSELRKATATDWSLFAALVVIIALIAYQQVSPNNSVATATVVTNNSAASVAGDIVQDIVDRLPNSIAVLPFENLSPDPDDEYFALGVHEEIINQLSKLRNVNVIARNSVMQYAGGDVPIPEIATQLNVETVMRGSLRYAENQVRVTAQLIDGMTNVPVWTTEDEGDLSNIFAIQSDIAMSIANSLQATYSAAEQESIEKVPTDSPEAYALYLQAVNGIMDAQAQTALLDQALELDPAFAMAYVQKSIINNRDRVRNASVGGADTSEAAWLQFRSERDRISFELIDRALELDPNLATAYAVRARINYELWNPQAAFEDLDRALQLNPNDTSMLNLMADFEWAARQRIGEAIRLAERWVELDPNQSQAHLELGYYLHFSGRHAEASDSIQECINKAPGRAACRRGLAATEFVRGNHEMALETLRLTEQVAGLDGAPTTAWLTYGYGLLGQVDDAYRTFQALQVLAAEDYIDPGLWAWAYMGVKDYDAALAELNKLAANQELLRQRNMTDYFINNIWFDSVLDQPEFVDVRERLRAWN